METSKHKDLNFTRVLNAPASLVYKVWTDPMHLEQWWGPKGFTNPVCRADAKPGGDIYIDMKGPDGTVYPMFGTFKELDEPNRIVFIAGALDKDGNRLFEIENTVTFEAMGDKTKLTLHTKVLRATEMAAPHLDGAEVGWTQSLERLDNYVADASAPPLVIERTYNAPAQLIWKALTDNNDMKQWYFQLPEFKADVGFEFQFSGTDKEGNPKLHLCRVTEVVPGKKLTHSWAYAGVTGISFVTWELFAEGEKTRLKLTHAGLDTFPKENQNFAKQNFEGGWTTILGTWLKDFVEK